MRQQTRSLANETSCYCGSDPDGTGAGAFSGQRERHAVSAQTLEQAHPERQGALHPYAVVVTGPARPEPQPAPDPGPRSG